MVFKVLCLTLVACTLVQAAPQPGWRWDPFESARTFIGAGFETAKENTDSMFSKVEAAVDAGHESWKAGVQGAETFTQILLSGPRLAIKVGEKRLDNSNKSKNFFELSNEAVSEVIDENVESKKKTADAVIDAGASISNAVNESRKSLWTVGTSPARFAGKVVEDFLNSDASATEILSSSSKSADALSASRSREADASSAPASKFTENINLPKDDEFVALAL